ncbi:MAG TPA: tetratricopeptide repeat protein [Pyrinomonadaceae bacterium]|nr:tetratricopeptide repeat protein [Pyrinomonadaceae bacterium]
MNTKNVLARSLFASLVLFAILLTTIPVSAQGDLIPISDVTGGSGIFVLRGGAKGPPKRVLPSRASRSKADRMETARKVSKQYTALAKVAPRRVRTEAIDPNDSRLKDIPRMSKDDASKLFSGVGEYYMDRDNYNEAINFFRESLTLNPSNTISQTGLSEALALKGNELLVKDSFPVARTFFEEALKYNPKNAPAYYGLAEVLTEMGKDDDATKNYESALSNDKDLSEIYTPLGALYFQKGNIAKADEYLTKAAAASSTDPQAHYYLGLVRYTQNQNDAALAEFKRSASLDASNPEVAFYTGSTLLRLNKNDLAVTEFTKATTLRANYFEAWMGLGEAQYELGNFAEAVKAYDKAAKLRNTNYEAFNNLGDSYRQMTPPNYNQAESNYNLAAMFIQRQPGFNKEDAADMYSKAAFSIAKQCEINIKQAKPCRWDAAVRALEEADKLSTSGVDAANLGWAYYNAARADMANGNTQAALPKLEKAKIALQKVANSNTNFVSGPMLNLGMALTDLKEYKAAIDILNKVVKKEPKWAFAINELGLAYRGDGNFKEAAKQFKLATDKDKTFAVAYYNLGEAQFRDGNLGDARKTMDQLRKIAPNLAAKLDVTTNGALRQGS